MKNWRVPAVLLGVLILAVAFRWDVNQTTSKGDIIKYKIDRWSGSVYRETFYPSYTEKQIGKQRIPGNLFTRESFTNEWLALTGLSTIWLLVTLPKKKDRSEVVGNQKGRE